MSKSTLDSYVDYFSARLNDPTLSPAEEDDLKYKISMLKIAMGSFVILSEMHSLFKVAEEKAKLTDEDIH